MDPFFLQLAIIFIPGMIWERIDAQFVQKRRPDQFEVLRRSFVFGLVAYLLTYGLYRLLNWEFQLVEMSKDKSILSTRHFNEIWVATGLGLVVSIPYVWVSNRRILPWIFQKIGASKRYGDEDVWDHTFNTRDAVVAYVHVRDH